MPPPNAAIVGFGTQKARSSSRAINDNLNDNFVLSGDANSDRIPAYFIYIYNTSNRDITIHRPWAHPSITLKAAPAGQDYGEPFVLEDIKQEMVDRQTSWEVGTRGVRGEFLAQDLLNPDRMWTPQQPDVSWKTEVATNVASMMNQGTNMYAFGCFWDRENPPSKEAIAKARARLEATYNQLIEDANSLSMQGADGLKEIGRNRLMGYAADYFGIDADWHRKLRGRKTCPGCGDLVPVELIAHKNDCYVWDWDKALAGGLRTKKQAVAAGVMEPEAAK